MGELTGVRSPSIGSAATGASCDGRGMRETTPGVNVGVGFRRAGGVEKGTLYGTERVPADGAGGDGGASLEAVTSGVAAGVARGVAAGVERGVGTGRATGVATGVD